MSAETDRIFMQYLTISAKPQPDNPEAAETGGAHVGCWIKDRTVGEAQIVAKKMIEDHGWLPVQVEEQKNLTADHYDDECNGKQYFDQALEDGEVLVFYTYPKDAKE